MTFRCPPAGTLAAISGALLTICFWRCLWRRSTVAAVALHNASQTQCKQQASGFFPLACDETYASRGKDAQQSTNGIHCLSSSNDKLTVIAKLDDKDIVSACLDDSSESADTASLSSDTPQTVLAESQSKPDGTLFYTAPLAITEVLTMSQHMQHTLSIPAPLWQDVEIAPDKISIAQTAAGADWILGQGSFGMVGPTLAITLSAAGRLRLVLLLAFQ